MEELPESERSEKVGGYVDMCGVIVLVLVVGGYGWMDGWHERGDGVCPLSAGLLTNSRSICIPFHAP